MSPIRILLVDDESRVAMALQRALSLPEGGGYQVQRCASGEEALALLQTTTYDLIITDLRMPGMSGLELLEQARQLNPSARGILMTAFGSPQVELLAMQLANAYLPKPFSIRMLATTVEQALTAPARQKPSILILEDNEDLRRLSAKALHLAGYQVEQAASLDDARQLLDGHTFDVFLYDAQLAATEGADLLQERAAQFDAGSTQIITIAGEAQYRVMFEDMGTAFLLRDPSAIESLVSLVNKIAPR